MGKFDNSTNDKIGYELDNDSEFVNDRGIFKRLFSLKNIIIYVVAFLISMISIERGNFVAPFGIAIVAAGMSNGVPIMFVLLASLIGTTIKFGWEETLSQGIIHLIFLVGVLFVKPKQDEYGKLKVGKQLIFAMIVQFIIMGIAKGFTGEYLYVAACNLFLAYVFYLVFANAIVAIDSLLQKLICTNEEIVSAVALFTIAFQSLGFVKVGEIQLNVILTFILLAIFAWKNGLYPSFISSLIASLVLCCLNSVNDVLVNSLIILNPIIVLIGLVRSFRFKSEEVIKEIPLLPERSGVIEESDMEFTINNDENKKKLKEKVKKKSEEITEKEFELIKNLSFLGIVAKKVEINKTKSGRKIVRVVINKCGNLNGNYCPIKGIAQELYKMFNEVFVLQLQKCGIREEKIDCEMVFISKDKNTFDISCASQKIFGSTMSSEVVETIRLDNGNYLISASGRDTAGEKAYKASKRTIKLYEDIISKQIKNNLLLDDNEEKTSSILKNTIKEFEKYVVAEEKTLNKNETTDKEVSDDEKSNDKINNNLDSLVLNMYDCTGSFIKFNATPTYLKRGKNVSIIQPENAKLKKEAEKIKITEVKFQSGDLIVMANLGVLESNLEYVDITYWVKELLENLSSDIPESVANIIMKESIENTQGIIDTNLRVIVIRIN